MTLFNPEGQDWDPALLYQVGAVLESRVDTVDMMNREEEWRG